MITPEYDLAVVGGGVAGLYCGMHAAPDWRVALFEGSHRLGGKLETVSMLGFDAEYGAMRFDPIRQFRMGELIKELGIETLPFPEYSSPPDQQHSLNYRLDADEQGLTTLELFRLAIQRVLGVSEAEMLALSEQQLESIRRESVFFDQPLWEQGLWNALGRVISHNALRYIVMEGSFFSFHSRESECCNLDDYLGQDAANEPKSQDDPSWYAVASRCYAGTFETAGCGNSPCSGADFAGTL